MERYGKIAVPGAVVGLVLSVLVGLLAGVGPGTVILRGLISAVVMGAGSAGLYAAAERLLPGVANGDLPADGAGAGIDAEVGKDSDGERAVPAPGGQLNIVVEDESEEWSDAAEVTEATEAAEVTEATEVAEGDGDGERNAAAEVEEVAELESAAETAPPASDDAEDDEVDDDLVEEIEEQSADDAEAVMNQAIAEEKYGSGVEIDDSVLDEMPDIGSFSGSFGSDDGSDGADDSGGGSSAQPPGGSPRNSAGGTAGNDPVQIAKALKTMLSRDGKE